MRKRFVNESLIPGTQAYFSSCPFPSSELQFRAVEFIGGSMDGVCLVSGIEVFNQPERDGEKVSFSLNGTRDRYVRRGVQAGVLYLDLEAVVI